MIGLKLGLEEAKLNQIIHKTSKSLDILTEVVSLWLRKENEFSDVPSWYGLYNAVVSISAEVAWNITCTHGIRKGNGLLCYAHS